MFNFNFSGKGLGLASASHFGNNFSCYILLTDQIWLLDCLYFLKYWAIFVLRLIVNQAMTSKNLKITVSFLSSHFATWPKSQDKNLNILRTKITFEVKLKAFFIIFKGLWVAKNCFRPELLNNYEKCFLFHLKSSFGSRDIKKLPLNFRRWLKINPKVYDVSICQNKNLSIT